MANARDHILDELEAIRAAKLTALKTGQSVQVPGSFLSQAVSYETLCRRERELRSRLLAASGMSRILRTRYTGYGSGKDWVDS